MPPGLRPPLLKTNRDHGINRRATAYSLAATAAGVSALALTQSAHASVVVTKTNIQVSLGSQAFIDLNKDGVNDFSFVGEGANYDHSFYATFVVKPLAGGKVMGGNRGPLGPYASALAKGANIGPSGHFSSSVVREQLTVERSVGSASGVTNRTYYGKWAGLTNRYLGVKFLIQGQTHYGWIRLSVSMLGRITGTITEYAYETVANRKIGAGNTTDTAETAAVNANPDISNAKGPSLGMLASGTKAVALWRRDQETAPYGSSFYK
jgi:hypothetical protein